ncbi:MAG: hypothetical protein WEA61_04005 [Anaerolineales bacterium]
MAKKSTTPEFRMDVPTAVRAAVIGGAIMVVLLVLAYANLGGLLSLAMLIPIAVGVVYVNDVSKKITPSYLEAAGGAAVAGVIYVLVVFIVGLILGSLLANMVAGEYSSLVGLGMMMGGSFFMNALISQLLQAALLAALGGAGLIFLRTQKIS